MPWLTQLARVARTTGYPVIEVDGWRTRGHGPQPEVDGVVCHHTAGWGDMHIVRDGRPGLDGPLSQIWLQRTGRIWIVAAGRCWHNAPSTSLGHTNGHSIGIEAENDGHTPWPEAQLDAYHRLCAALCLEFGLPASTVKGHKEVNTSKVDPHTLDMREFRAEVARLMKTGPGKPKETPIKIVLKDGVPQWPGRVLKLDTPYMRGADVRLWQQKLKDRGWAIDVDGIYGPQSNAVCAKYQERIGLPVTGKIDQATWDMTWSWRPPEQRQPGMVDESN